jgi:hypothetical protein
VKPFISVKTTSFLRYSFLFLLLSANFIIGAQGTPIPISPPSKQFESDSTEMLLFRVRSAFSLTSAMVRVLQAKSADTGTAAENPGGARAPASSFDASKDIVWGETLARILPFAAPLDVRLVGKNVVALIQIVPIELRTTVVDIIVQGQVWVKMPDDSLSFKTTVQTLSLPLGSRLYFYPLGVDTRMGAPIAVEIRVDRQAK